MDCKRFIILFLFCALFSQVVKSQYLENNPLPAQRIFYGGNVGLLFWNSTYFSIDPIIGYRISNRISAGIGGNYAYFNSQMINFSCSTFGVNTFASYTVIKRLSDILPVSDNGGLLLYGELNWINLKNYNQNVYPEISWISSPLMGIAYQSPIGPKSYMVIMLLYNFNENRYSPLVNPVYRVCMQF
jgi:hypothetical protein